MSAERLVCGLMMLSGLGAWLVPVDTGGQPWYLGPALFPRLVGVVLMAGGAWQLLGSRGSGAGQGSGWEGGWRACVLVAGLLMAPWLVERVGLPATAALLAVVGGLLLGVNVVKAGLVGAGMGLLAWAVFLRLLGVGR